MAFTSLAILESLKMLYRLTDLVAVARRDRARGVIEGVGRPNDGGYESGSKLHALHTLARSLGAPELREAYGVRPACWRFRRERNHRAGTFNLTIGRAMASQWNIIRP